MCVIVPRLLPVENRIHDGNAKRPGENLLIDVFDVAGCVSLKLPAG
jgi:hypothetical protein